MIDIHCHILPGVDDGAVDVEVSLAMARRALDEGITEIVATPHHRNRQWDNPKPSIVARVKKLNQLFLQNQVDLAILPGQEPRIFGEMAESEADQELMTVNNNKKYILVELPTHHVPRYAQQLFFDLQVKGVTPVIVHPERNQEIFEHPDILYNFITEGALSQVTASSIVGKEGRKIKKRAFQFLENNLSQFVASDAHNVSVRPFYIREAFLELEKQFGKEMTSIFNKNAEFLVNGELINSDAPIQIKEKKFLGFFN